MTKEKLLATVLDSESIMVMFKKCAEDFHSADFAPKRLRGCINLLFDRFAPFKEGDRVVLTETPQITEEKAWGWLGSKHFLVKGEQGTVRSVECNEDGFTANVEFDHESWLGHDKQINIVLPENRHSYHFHESYLKKVEPNEMPSLQQGH